MKKNRPQIHKSAYLIMIMVMMIIMMMIMMMMIKPNALNKNLTCSFLHLFQDTMWKEGQWFSSTITTLIRAKNSGKLPQSFVLRDSFQTVKYRGLSISSRSAPANVPASASA